MNKNNFSISEAIGFGWQKVKENFLFFALLLLATIIIPGLVSFLQALLNNDTWFYTMAFSVFSWIVSMIISMGVIRITLRLVDGKSYKIEDLFSVSNQLLQYILGSLLYGTLIFVGFLLLIVPGVIFAVKYQYVTYLIIDKGLDIGEAFSKSSQMTQGHKFHLWIFSIVLGLVNILGFLSLIIGLFVTIPLSWIACAYVYRKLGQGIIR